MSSNRHYLALGGTYLELLDDYLLNKIAEQVLICEKIDAHVLKENKRRHKRKFKPVLKSLQNMSREYHLNWGKAMCKRYGRIVVRFQPQLYLLLQKLKSYGYTMHDLIISPNTDEVWLTLLRGGSECSTYHFDGIQSKNKLYQINRALHSILDYLRYHPDNFLLENIEYWTWSEPIPESLEDRHYYHWWDDYLLWR